MEVVRNIQRTLDGPEDAHSVLDETFDTDYSRLLPPSAVTGGGARR
jgi:hypothetical protein